LSPDERRRLQDADPEALCISARSGEGVSELVETVAARLALDVERVTLTFDPNQPDSREQMARLYRLARVLVHETKDGMVKIVADIPRRLLSRLDPVGR
jgi:GTP-binding protein HflX